MDVAAIGEAMGCTPVEAMVALLAEAPETACIGHAMHDDDVRAILADPRVFVASDASAIDPASPAGALPVHPRDYGTFPRAIAMARDERLLGLEAVIAKMTSSPADRFGLRDRGRIAEGAFADLVLLDPIEVRDTATFAAPHAFPTASTRVGERRLGVDGRFGRDRPLRLRDPALTEGMRAGGRIRTDDLPITNRLRYRAAPRRRAASLPPAERRTLEATAQITNAAQRDRHERAERRRHRPG